MYIQTLKTEIVIEIHIWIGTGPKSKDFGLSHPNDVQVITPIASSPWHLRIIIILLYMVYEYIWCVSLARSPPIIVYSPNAFRVSDWPGLQTRPSGLPMRRVVQVIRVQRLRVSSWSLLAAKTRVSSTMILLLLE